VYAQIQAQAQPITWVVACTANSQSYTRSAMSAYVESNDRYVSLLSCVAIVSVQLGFSLIETGSLGGRSPDWATGLLKVMGCMNQHSHEQNSWLLFKWTVRSSSWYKPTLDAVPGVDNDERQLGSIPTFWIWSIQQQGELCLWHVARRAGSIPARRTGRCPDLCSCYNHGNGSNRSFCAAKSTDTGIFGFHILDSRYWRTCGC
jgi:hypothetical protein